jgi:3-methyladenine DNA glycosylase AlkD
MRLELAELDLEIMYENHASETNPWELADTLHKKFTNKIESQQHLVDTLTNKLELAQTARKLQQKQIKELQEELIEVEQQVASISPA